MSTKSCKALLISFFIIILIGLFSIETNAQLNLWPAAISDPFASVLAGFGSLPVLGGTFGVTSAFGAPGSFLYPSYDYYDYLGLDSYWYWEPYPYDVYSYYYPYPYEYYQPYFGVSSFYFPIYTEAPWWASALAFL